MSTNNTLTEAEESVGSAARKWRGMPERLTLTSGSHTISSTLKDITAADANVELFAVVTVANDKSKRGVQSLGNYSLSELYFGSESPVFEFNKAIEELISLSAAGSLQSDEVARNTTASKIWYQIGLLKSYLGRITDSHDEVIAVLVYASSRWKNTPVDQPLLGQLRFALQALSNRVVYSDDILNDFEDDMEAAGVSLKLIATQ